MIIIYILQKSFKPPDFMTWQLQFNPNHQNCGEACLTLSRRSRCEPLRCWFGPLATQLVDWLQDNTPAVNFTVQRIIIIDKTLAQHLLVQASFHHQACLQRHQVAQDMANLPKPLQAAMADVLLFIRMAQSHPCHHTLETLINTQLPHCQDLESILQQLLQAELIQQIHGEPPTYGEKYGDKNAQSLGHAVLSPTATH